MIREAQMEDPVATQERFTAADLVNGLVRVLCDRGYTSFYVRTDRLDAAFEAAYTRLREIEDKFNVRVPFRVARDDFGESPVLRNALNGAAQRDVISFDNPEFQDMRLNRRKIEATVVLDRLPGNPDLYSELADRFLQEYEAADAQTERQDLGVA
jgi:hypothetical protein